MACDRAMLARFYARMLKNIIRRADNCCFRALSV
jgi:hypothetical protein